jgi:Glucose / Sorbosone dehydrogenase
MYFKFLKILKSSLVLILLIVFCETLILLPRPQTSIAYGIPPTSGQIPWKPVGFANEMLEKTRGSLDFIRNTQRRVYLNLKLQISGLDETTFIIESNFHNLVVRKILFSDLRNTTKKLGGNALGSIEAIEKGFLIVTRDGKVNVFNDKNRSLLLIGNLTGIKGDKRNIEGLRDSIVVSEDRSKINLASSYSVISEINGKFCFGVKVFLWNINKDGIWKVELGPEIFSTNECVSESLAHASGVGARLAYLKDKNSVLLSLGEMNEIHPEKTFYGKITEIYLNGNSKTKSFSQGFRNPAGMTISGGNVYVANQGPRGGDTISLVTSGSDFGWPEQSFGTEYAFSGYPNPKNVEENGKYNQPDLVFVPTYALSDLHASGANRLDFWSNQKGSLDLLATSLKGESLLRCRISPLRNTIVYCEPIYFGERLRSVSSNNSTIVILSDSGHIFLVEKQ